MQSVPTSPPNLGKVHILHPKGIIVSAINQSLGEDVWQVMTGRYGTWVDGPSFPSSHLNHHSFPLSEAMRSASVNGLLGFDKVATGISVNIVVGFVDSFGLKGGGSEAFYPDEVRKDLSLEELEGNSGVNSEKQPIKSQCSRCSCKCIRRRVEKVQLVIGEDVMLSQIISMQKKALVGRFLGGSESENPAGLGELSLGNFFRLHANISHSV